MDTLVDVLRNFTHDKKDGNTYAMYQKPSESRIEVAMPLLTTETLTAEEMKGIVYSEGYHAPTQRFLPFKEGGVFEYFHASSDLASSYTTFYPVVREAELIVGLAKLQEDAGAKDRLWVCFLSIDPEYQGRGYSKKLMQEIGTFAQDSNFKSIELSYFSSMGRERLAPAISRYAGSVALEIISADFEEL